MKGIQLFAPNEPYRYSETIPDPKLNGPYDMKIRIEAASYCHTDLVLQEGFPVHGGVAKWPIIPSHEGVGTVVEIGDKVDQSLFKPGVRVGATHHYHMCGECPECKRDPKEGHIFCQTDLHTHGLTHDGALAEYLVVDSRHCFVLPDEISFLDAAPLMCAGITIHKALERCELKKGDWVAIIGAGGGLGHLGCQFAKGMGYNCVAVDVSDQALELVKELGCADLIVDARKQTPEQARESILEVTDPDKSVKGRELSGGVHAVIVMPSSQAAFDMAFVIVRKHGKIIMVSVPENGWRVDSVALLFKDLTIRGSLFSCASDAQRMLNDTVKWGVKVSRRVWPLKQINEAVQDSLKGGKVVIDMSL